MLRIGIIVGSTRPGRRAGTVAAWVHALASRRADATFEVVDIADHDLPLLDESLHPALGRYEREHTRAWAHTIDAFDAFVFVTPEYNHGPPAALKNAIDFLHREWNDKAAGFVSYGANGGVLAVEHLRLVLATVRIATVRAQVALSLYTDFDQHSRFSPQGRRESELQAMLDQLVAWGAALRSVRVPAPPAAGVHATEHA